LINDITVVKKIPMLISVNNSSICDQAPRLSMLSLKVLMFYV